MQGLQINSRRLKFGWGKHSGPLNGTTLSAVQLGASRNICTPFFFFVRCSFPPSLTDDDDGTLWTDVGGITDWDAFSEDRLRRDFSEYGE